MTDITERLRMDADNMNPYCMDQDEIMEAADTIDTLRQRVAELEAAQQQGDPVLYQCTKCGGANYGCMCASLSGCTEPLYAAPPTQLGEPVAWMVSFDAKLGGANVTDKLLIWRKGDASNQVREELIRKIEPLYAAAPQTCFSAADMADAQAKAAQVEREECAKVCESVVTQTVLGGNEEYNTGRAMAAAVCANSIRMRGDQ